MELRMLKVFLTIAKEENITRAAGLLHVTQPTLSRQLMQLEEELGVQLFRRSNHSMALTEEGMLLRRRAQEIVDLTEEVVEEFAHRDKELSGVISIGCGETQNMIFLAQYMQEFREMHPAVQFHVYTAIADEIKERIEKGRLDMGLLLEPVDLGKYNYIRMPYKERWGALVWEGSPLQEKEEVTARELSELPLIMVHRESVRNELENWCGPYYEKLEVAATYNLFLNAAYMVRERVGAALCFQVNQEYPGTKFIPLAPVLETGAVLVWKKEQIFSPAVLQFMKYLKEQENLPQFWEKYGRGYLDELEKPVLNL